MGIIRPSFRPRRGNVEEPTSCDGSDRLCRFFSIPRRASTARAQRWRPETSEKNRPSRQVQKERATFRANWRA
ncbi:MAG: hypothetical protein C4334_00930 [Pyrinomonas sp.]